MARRRKSPPPWERILEVLEEKDKMSEVVDDYSLYKAIEDVFAPFPQGDALMEALGRHKEKSEYVQDLVDKLRAQGKKMMDDKGLERQAREMEMSVQDLREMIYKYIRLGVPLKYLYGEERITWLKDIEKMTPSEQKAIQEFIRHAEAMEKPITKEIEREEQERRRHVKFTSIHPRRGRRYSRPTGPKWTSKEISWLLEIDRKGKYKGNPEALHKAYKQAFPHVYREQTAVVTKRRDLRRRTGTTVITSPRVKARFREKYSRKAVERKYKDEELRKKRWAAIPRRAPGAGRKNLQELLKINQREERKQREEARKLAREAARVSAEERRAEEAAEEAEARAEAERIRIDTEAKAKAEAERVAREEAERAEKERVERETREREARERAARLLTPITVPAPPTETPPVLVPVQAPKRRRRRLQ